MDNKKVTSKETLFDVLNLLEELNIKYWIEGGWGVDILCGKQSREHRDIDIDFDYALEPLLLDALKKLGYAVKTNLSPSRIELQHSELGYLDIHPLILNQDGGAMQVAPDGGLYLYKAEWFTTSIFEGREIPCFSAEAQKLFHNGYELREVDHLDIKNLESAFPEECLKADRFGYVQKLDLGEHAVPLGPEPEEGKGAHKRKKRKKKKKAKK